jgi:hypothetical protein
VRLEIKVNQFATAQSNPLSLFLTQHFFIHPIKRKFMSIAIKKLAEKMKMFTGLFGIAALLSACASGPPFEKITSIPDNKALIYVYRPSSLQGAAFSPEVKMDEKTAFKLPSGGYFAHFATPGKNTVSITNVGTRTVDIDAKAGETYYVKGGTVPMGFGVPAIALVPAETGASEVQDCKRITELAQVVSSKQ